MRLEDGGQDRVFREEPREERHARDRERRDEERRVRDRNLPREPAHPAEILFPPERVDHGARSEKQTCLEEGVRQDVEHPGDERADPAREKHVTELRDRRVGEDLLDVVLGEADRRGEEGGEAAHDRHDEEGVGRKSEEHVAPGDHVDAGRDHRRGVDQSGHRRRSRHRVREPDVERHLRGLSHRSQEQAEADERHPGGVRNRIGSRGREHLAEVERAEEGEHSEDAQDEAEVPDAVHDERLLAGVRRELLVVVVPDQEVGAESHALPAHEHHQEVRREHERQHREHEQVQVREVAAVAGLVPHIAHRIDVDQEPDERDEADHQRGEGIQPERRVDEPLAGRSRDLPGRLIHPERDPPPQVQNVVRARGKRRDTEVEDRAECEHAGERDAPGPDERVERLPSGSRLQVDMGMGMPRGLARLGGRLIRRRVRCPGSVREEVDDPVDQEPGQGEGRNEPEEVAHPPAIPASCSRLPRSACAAAGRARSSGRGRSRPPPPRS